MSSAMPTTVVHGIVSACNAHALADRVLARPQHLGHRLAHDDDAWRAGAVVGREAAAADDPRAHRPEVVGRRGLEREAPELAHRVDAGDEQVGATTCSRTARCSPTPPPRRPESPARVSSSVRPSRALGAVVELHPAHVAHRRAAPARRRSPGALLCTLSRLARTGRRRRAARRTTRPAARAARRACASADTCPRAARP